ncbi:MAG TPA: RNA repair transcriptional activator RtcR [Planctomycetota bacterium]|nr:RNA repair transcriptional activator RtcR [Planctomycetota bacterium]
MTAKKTVLIGLLGPTLDEGVGHKRWEKWRPSVSLCQHEDLIIDRYEMLYQKRWTRLCETLARDVRDVSPETEVRCTEVEFKDPWDFEEVYGALHDFAHGYRFDPDEEDYLIHITTGTHVAQICLFLLTESNAFPARLIQSSPPKRSIIESPGEYRIIDLDLSKYDRIATRFQKEQADEVTLLKSGIETRNAAFNRMIEQIERVAIHSEAPVLLMGPTGAGKSQLARRIYELKKARRQFEGAFVEVNCATLRGDAAMSALFGHKKGAFTGALQDRAGLLKAANGGMLFLDEAGELGLDEQAMLLRALEEKRFLPMGSDEEAESDFQLICGTNRDLSADVAAGRFREDLLTRINLWTFRLPGLRERAEDIEPNLQYELDGYARASGVHVTFNKEARDRYLAFASSPEARWAANFRDLDASITRMATLAPGGRITAEIVEEELARLRETWRDPEAAARDDGLEELLGAGRLGAIDLFDRVQLAEVVRVCRRSRSLSEAGRVLFEVSRCRRATANDADRLRKYLARFGLSWDGVVGSGS